MLRSYKWLILNTRFYCCVIDAYIYKVIVVATKKKKKKAIVFFE